MLVDPIILQAERIFSQRQTRNLVIDPDLLGEPGWDILLCAFIAGGRKRACSAPGLAQELGLSLQVTQRWVGLLSSRGLIDQNDTSIKVTPKADKLLRTMFGSQMREFLQELGGGDGIFEILKGSMPKAN